jgi:hypothetical protein
VSEKSDESDIRTAPAPTLTLPLLPRCPSAEEVETMLESCLAPVNTEGEDSQFPIMNDLSLLLIGSNRFQTLFTMQSLQMVFSKPEQFMATVAALIQTAMYWGMRTGVLMERRDREAREMERMVSAGMDGSAQE